MPPTIITPGTVSTAARHFKSSTNRREALSLYREILRTCKAFHWCDEQGIPWNRKLKEEARREFEASREETDPLIIARMLVTGRDCVQQVQQKFNAADRAAWERIQKDSSNRGAG
uniref:Complex 1 LYR protein domain-containing protein n=1 Tax=Pseudictyota dubia TaxID=2749911 RepID=A0A7R9Z9Y3_9STRA|mmetsp:Transcript_3309/g.5804  ORF Transcript_3309/g.5804 Transcript_3309/m.5804 type:complete len:115 (+) Transcript_3309:109-453(+)